MDHNKIFERIIIGVFVIANVSILTGVISKRVSVLSDEVVCESHDMTHRGKNVCVDKNGVLYDVDALKQE